MKKQSPSFETDGTQPDYVRDLLDAGRNDAMRGYDVDAGLARHLAAVQAGAPLPPWANELVASGGQVAAAAGAGAVAAKLATGKVVAGIAFAVLAAGAIAAAVTLSAPEEAARVAPSQPPAVPVAPLAPPTSAAPSSSDGMKAGSQPANASDDTAGEAVELEIAPITARPKADVRSAGEGLAEVEPKTPNARASSAKTLEALIENVGKQTSRPAAKGHVDLVAPSETVARAEAPAAQSERTAQAAPTAPAPAIDDTKLEREMGMLAVAQRVLKSDPERALRLARQGEQEFAGSMFTQERQQVLLLALIELGRTDEARRLALPYLKRWPNGPFSDRLRSALAAAKPEN